MATYFVREGDAKGEIDPWESVVQMTIDLQKSLMTYIWDLLTTDTALKAAMGGTVRCYLTWAKEDATFPYLVHRLDIRKESGIYIVQKAAYYLDIWSDSPNADEILAIRERLIQLLDERVFNTDDVKLVHIEIMSDAFISETEQGIWHYATLWDWIFRRDSEADSIERR